MAGIGRISQSQIKLDSQIGQLITPEQYEKLNQIKLKYNSNNKLERTPGQDKAAFTAILKFKFKEI